LSIDGRVCGATDLFGAARVIATVADMPACEAGAGLWC